jgi:hypothetical protein
MTFVSIDRETHQSSVEASITSTTRSLPGMLLDYEELKLSNLSARQIGRQQIVIQTKVANALDSALSDFSSIAKDRFTTDEELQHAEEAFKAIVQIAELINFPDDISVKISKPFIDSTLDPNNNVAEAAAIMAMAVGDSDTVRFAKANYLKSVFNKNQIKGPDTIDLSAPSTAEKMLNGFGIGVTRKLDTPFLDKAILGVEKHGRGVAIKVGIIAMAGSLFAPSIAHASEPVPPNTPIAQGSSLNKQKTVPVSPSIDTTDKAPQKFSLSPDSHSPTKAEVVAVKAAEETANNFSTKSNKSNTSTKPSAPEKASPNAGDASAPVDTAPPEISIAPDISTKTTINPEIVPVVPSVDSLILQPNPHQTDGSIATPEVPVAPIPISLVPDQRSVPTTPDKQQLTPNQIALQAITMEINNNDIDMATAQIIMAFHVDPGTGTIASTSDTAPTSPDSTNATAVTLAPAESPKPNTSLQSNIKTLVASYTTLLAAGGHKDVAYENTTLAALSILNAAASDPTVLKSPDLMHLIDNAKTPTDPYQIRAFKLFSDAAAKAFTDNPELIKTLTTIDAARLQEIYAYILMSETSDLDQAKAVQSLKDADAKAAAEKAAADAVAKAAADAVAKGQEQAGSTQTVQTEAMTNLINKSSGVQQKKYDAMQFFMNKGLTPMLAAAIVGNLSGESGMDSTRSQDPHGPGRYLAQWTINTPRYYGLLAHAASQHKPATDFDVQLEYIWIELNGSHAGALHALQASQNLSDAVYAIQGKYEVTGAYLNRKDKPAKFNAELNTRIDLIKGEYDAFNAEVTVITNARAAAVAAAAAAAEAAATAERQSQAEHGMDLPTAKRFMANYMDHPENIKWIGGSGTRCPHGALANCTSFTSYFVNKYFGGIKDMGSGKGGSGNGDTFVKTVVSRNPGILTGNTPKINAVFSTPKGSTQCDNGKLCGHTAVILGMDVAAGTVIIGEAGCSANLSWDTAHVENISDYSGPGISYFYTDGLETRNLDQ